MDVSFTGIQNVGAWGVSLVRNTTPETQRFVCQLTDTGTKDLSKFKDVFEKFPDPLNKGFLRFDLLKPAGTDETFFTLNNKPLVTEDETLSVFQKLSKLFSKIANSEEKMLVQDEYLKSNESLENLTKGIVEGDDISMALILQDFPVEDCHEFRAAQKYANNHVQEIDNSIMQYLKL